MLRYLEEQDISALVSIEKATQFSPWSEDTFKKCIILGSQGWVVEVNQEIIGFILLYAKLGEGHILNLGIHPAYQRQGFGTLLMNKILEIAKNEALHIIYLEVRHSNHAAIGLYEKMGFERIGVRKNYYRAQNAQEDALVLAKQIANTLTPP
jgi:ribosomal-protein-alanine N-acetyltransferase